MHKNQHNLSTAQVKVKKKKKKDIILTPNLDKTTTFNIMLFHRFYLFHLLGNLYKQ